jgi:3-deoxy-7-phosphoheptulonate synthase
MGDWSPDSWRAFSAAQQPDWPDAGALDRALDQLRRVPPLVFAGEARTLTAALGEAAAGRAFVLQAGDCAESFDAFSADTIRDKLKVILQMAVVLTYGSGVPTVKIGRIAGQFAKPRSSSTETRDGVALPSFRGDMVNDYAFEAGARTADPDRLLRVYHQSASTLNLLRAFAKGGFADLSRVHAWNLEYLDESPEGRRYDALAAEIDRALRFMAACGIDLAGEHQLHEVDFYTSHEALILGYEEALTRQDTLTGDWYDCSAHLVWIGDRTRQLDGAHVEFHAGIKNPIGVKLGPNTEPGEAVALCERLNPERIPGRLTLVSRMGAARVGENLPPIKSAEQSCAVTVVLKCDPIHGKRNTHASG